MPRWLLHTVGGADLGVPLQDQPLLERRVRAAAALADDELPERLAALRWPGPTTGVVAPLAALAGNLPTDEPVRLLLLCTEFTRHVAAVIAGALALSAHAVRCGFRHRAACAHWTARSRFRWVG